MRPGHIRGRPRHLAQGVAGHGYLPGQFVAFDIPRWFPVGVRGIVILGFDGVHHDLGVGEALVLEEGRDLGCSGVEDAEGLGERLALPADGHGPHAQVGSHPFAGRAFHGDLPLAAGLLSDAALVGPGGHHSAGDRADDHTQRDDNGRAEQVDTDAVFHGFPRLPDAGVMYRRMCGSSFTRRRDCRYSTFKLRLAEAATANMNMGTKGHLSSQAGPVRPGDMKLVYPPLRYCLTRRSTIRMTSQQVLSSRTLIRQATSNPAARSGWVARLLYVRTRPMSNAVAMPAAPAKATHHVHAIHPHHQPLSASNFAQVAVLARWSMVTKMVTATSIRHE